MAKAQKERECVLCRLKLALQTPNTRSGFELTSTTFVLLSTQGVFHTKERVTRSTEIYWYRYIQLKLTSCVSHRDDPKYGRLRK